VRRRSMTNRVTIGLHIAGREAFFIERIAN
jgi:hypothetical protein